MTDGLVGEIGADPTAAPPSETRGHAARVFTIPAASPFLPTLAAGLVDGPLDPDAASRRDPLALARATVFLPTRRAARAFRDALLAASPTASLVLPRILTLGDPGEEDGSFLDTSDEASKSPVAGQDRPLPAIAARSAMAGLVGTWDALIRREQLDLIPGRRVAIPESPADAIRLAADLLDLVEQVDTQELDWSDLAALAPDGLSRYWQITLQFLEIAMAAWPQYLAEVGAVSLASHRRRLIDAEAARLAALPPDGPVIVAGSTGSVPATARLMAAVGRLRAGAIVLPGLDPDLSAGDLDALATDPEVGTDQAGPVRRPAVEHPQFGLVRLLRELSVDVADVVPLGAERSAPLATRARLVSAALRPAQTTDRWRHDRTVLGDAAIASALDGVDLIDAADDREEALAVATGLREAVAGGRSAALVTPDRQLARRVAAELARWRIEADDSAGVPLGAAPAGVLARLVATAVVSDRAADVLGLLKHPLASLGLDPKTRREGVAALESIVFRIGRIGTGPAAILARLDRLPEATQASGQQQQVAARKIAETLAAALRPLTALEGAVRPPAEFAPAHLAAIAAIAAPPPEEASPSRSGPSADRFADLAQNLATTADGRALFRALGEIADATSPETHIGLSDWPSVFEALAGDVTVRPDPKPWLPRVAILGPLEARLQTVDHVFLGGLSEGTWPAAADPGPWMSRGMMQMFGLDLPERRVGLAAHDFVQGLGADRVTISRARRSGTAPVVASRWVQRLAALAGTAAFDPSRARGERLIGLANALDAPTGAPQPATRPEPRPPVDARPTRLSITEIPLLVRDPYAIYARRVLDLRPLDPLDPEPGAADRGELLHAILADVLEAPGAISGPEGIARFLAIAERALARFADQPAFLALWQPLMRPLAEAFIADLGRRDDIAERHAEIAGEIAVETPSGSVTLRGRADRIDVRTDGAIEILDYKTGAIPSKKEVDAHLEPQLPLAGVIARRAGFAVIGATAPIASLTYVKVGGAGAPIEPRDAGNGEAGALVAEAGARLDALLARYAFEDQPYLSRARVKFSGTFDQPYDHLARAQEWADTGDTAGDGEE